MKNNVEPLGCFRTSDGKLFSGRGEAEKHQDNLNKINFLQSIDQPAGAVGTLSEWIDDNKELIARALIELYGWNPNHPNGSPRYANDGTMLNPEGNRSIFDDVDE